MTDTEKHNFKKEVREMKKNFLDILKAKRKEQETEIRKLDKVFSDLDKLTEMMITEVLP